MIKWTLPPLLTRLSLILGSATAVTSCGLLAPGNATLSHQVGNPFAVPAIASATTTVQDPARIAVIAIGEAMSSELVTNLLAAGLTAEQAAVVTDSAQAEVVATAGTIGVTQLMLVEASPKAIAVAAGPFVRGSVKALDDVRVGLVAVEGRANIAKVLMGSAFSSLGARVADVDHAAQLTLQSAMVGAAVVALNDGGLGGDSATLAVESLTAGAVESLSRAGISGGEAAEAAANIAAGAIERFTEAQLPPASFDAIVGAAADGSVGGLIAAGVDDAGLGSAVQRVASASVTAMTRAGTGASAATLASGAASIAAGAVGGLRKSGLPQDQLVASGAIGAALSGAIGALPSIGLDEVGASEAIGLVTGKGVAAIARAGVDDPASRKAALTSAIDGAIGSAGGAGLRETGFFAVAMKNVTKAATSALSSAGFAAADLGDTAFLVTTSSLAKIATLPLTSVASASAIGKSVAEGTVAGCIDLRKADGLSEAAMKSAAVKIITDGATAASAAFGKSGLFKNASDRASFAENVGAGGFKGLAVNSVASSAIDSITSAVVSATDDAGLKAKLQSLGSGAAQLATRIQSDGVAACTKSYADALDAAAFWQKIDAAGGTIYCEPTGGACPMRRADEKREAAWVAVTASLCELVIGHKGTSAQDTTTTASTKSETTDDGSDGASTDGGSAGKDDGGDGGVTGGGGAGVGGSGGSGLAGSGGGTTAGNTGSGLGGNGGVGPAGSSGGGLGGSGGGLGGSGGGTTAGNTGGPNPPPPGSCLALGATPFTPTGTGADNNPPTLLSVNFAATAYTAGGIGAVIFTATDDLSGVSNFQNSCWSIKSDKGSSTISACGEVKRFADGSFCFDFSLSPFLESDTYRLATISIADAAGHSAYYEASPMDTSYDTTSIPVATTTVTGGTPDLQAPILTYVEFSTSSYEAPATGIVRFTATDDVSGITDFQSSCWSIRSASGITTLAACGTIATVGADVYELSFEIGPYVEAGVYRLESLQLVDRAGNSRSYLYYIGTDSYNGTAIAAPTVTINNANGDITPPTLTDVAFEMPSYAPGDTGRIIFTATDDISGIAAFQSSCWGLETASANKLDPCGNIESLGSDQFALSFQVGAFAELAPYFLNSLRVCDKAQNCSDYAEDGSYYVGTSIPVVSVSILLPTTPAVFTSLDLDGPAADGFIHLDDQNQNVAFTSALVATGYSTAAYALASSGTTCDANLTYGSLPTSGAAEFSMEGVYVVCVDLLGGDGVHVYGQSDPVYFDVTPPSFNTLNLIAPADDYDLSFSDRAAAVSFLATVEAVGYATVEYAVVLSTATCDASLTYDAAAPLSDSSAFTTSDTYMACVRLKDDAGNATYGVSPAFTASAFP